MAININIDINDFTKDVTTNEYYEVSGTGIFDILMSTATKHLTAQYDSNRLRGEDYADAYIEIYKATLAAALEAWLQRGRAEAEAARIIAETNKITTMLPKEAALMEAQTQKLIAEKSLIPAQIALTEAQTAKALAEAELVPAQIELVEAQIEKTLGEAALLPKQLELVEAQVALAEKQVDLVLAQIEAEKSKSNLHRRQIEAFDEDYKHKIFKIMMDSWAIGFSVAKDAFLPEGVGMPLPMASNVINDVWADYILKDLDNYEYGRPDL